VVWGFEFRPESLALLAFVCWQANMSMQREQVKRQELEKEVLIPELDVELYVKLLMHRCILLYSYMHLQRGQAKRQEIEKEALRHSVLIPINNI
jgi:hypothetical protein